MHISACRFDHHMTACVFQSNKIKVNKCIIKYIWIKSI